MTDSKEIKVKEKQEVTTPAEQTIPGLVFTPEVDVFETDQAITLLADIPGVKPEKLNIDLRDDILTIAGDVDRLQTADEELLVMEYETGRYYRQFTLSEVIDQTKIDATLNLGVLRLRLPKVAGSPPKDRHHRRLMACAAATSPGIQIHGGLPGFALLPRHTHDPISMDGSSGNSRLQKIPQKIEACWGLGSDGCQAYRTGLLSFRDIFPTRLV